MSDSAAHAAQPDDEGGWGQVRLLHTFSEEVRNAVRAAYPTATMTLQEFLEEASRERNDFFLAERLIECFPRLEESGPELQCLRESLSAHNERGWGQLHLLDTFTEDVRNAVRAAYSTARKTLQEALNLCRGKQPSMVAAILGRCFQEIYEENEFNCLFESFSAYMDSSPAPEQQSVQSDTERGWGQLRLVSNFNEEVHNAVRAAYPKARKPFQELVEECREKTEGKRGSFLTKCFPEMDENSAEWDCLWESFLAHMNSPSAPQQPSQQPSKCPISADLLNNQYNDAKDQGNALDEFHKHIAEYSSDLHRRVFPICQSSGVGKSRMCVELGKKQALVYLPLAVQDRQNSAVPATMKEFLQAIKTAGKHKDEDKRRSAREHAVKLLLSSVCRAVDRYCTNNDSLAPDPNELWEAQFTGEYRFYKELHSAWSELCQTHPLNNINSSPAEYKNRDSNAQRVSFNAKVSFEKTEPGQKQISDLHASSSSSQLRSSLKTPGKKSSESQLSEQLSNLSLKEAPAYELYIVFDEIAVLSLGENPDDPSSPIRCLYRILDHSRKGIKLITLSTTSWYSHVMPGHVHSIREFECHDSPVFFDLIFQDLFDSDGSVFGKGRPLWAKHRERAAQLTIGSTFSSSPWRSTIALAQNLLLGKNRGQVVLEGKQPLVNTTSSLSLLALALSRLPIAAFGKVADELVAHHLAMLVGRGANAESPRLMCRYLSEPIIAEAAACTMNGIWLLPGQVETPNPFSAKAVVDGLCKLETSSMLVSTSTGDRGEVTGALSLLFTLDELRAEKMKRNKLPKTSSSSKAKNREDSSGQKSIKSCYNPQDNREDSFSDDVSAIDFIKALCSAKQLKDRRLLKWLDENLKDYVVSCTHFVKPTDKESIGEKTVKGLHERCAGIYLPTNFFCSDLVIIMRKKDRDGCYHYAVILISMKNYKKKITDASLEKFMEHLTPDILEYCDLVREKPFVSIVFNTGGESFENDAIVPHFRRMEGSGLFLSADLRNNFGKLPQPLRESLWHYSARLRDFEPKERFQQGSLSELYYVHDRGVSESIKVADQMKKNENPRKKRRLNSDPDH